MEKTISESTLSRIQDINKVHGFNPGELMGPLDDGSGDYLAHQARLAWFWLRYPDGKIHVQLVEKGEKEAVFYCRIYAKRTDPEEAFIADDYGSCRLDEANEKIGNRQLETAATRARSRALGAAMFNSHSADAYAGEGGRPSDLPVKSEAADSGKVEKRGDSKKTGIPVAKPARQLVDAAKETPKEAEPAGTEETDPDQLTMGEVVGGAGSETPDDSGGEPGLPEKEPGAPEQEPVKAEQECDAPEQQPGPEAVPDVPKDQPDAKPVPQKPEPASDKAGKPAAKQPAPVAGWIMTPPGDNSAQFVEPITEEEAGMTVAEAMAFKCTAISQTNQYYGKTLGEISIENPGLITWLVTRFKGKDEEVVKAAKLLLSASSKGGKLAG